MSNKRIIDLPAAPSVGTSALVEISQAGVSQKATVSQLSAEGFGPSAQGTTALTIGQDYVDVVFPTEQLTDGWTFSECNIINVTDPDPLNIMPGVIISKTTIGFRMALVGLPDTANYFLHWGIMGVNITPPVPATTYTFNGPATGFKDVAATFNVSLPPGGTVPAPVTVTPSDGGGGGTFIPTSVILLTVSPTASFSYTPASYGTKTLSVTNDGGLTNPADRSFISLAATYTFTGPNSGFIGVPSTDFTVALPAGGVTIGVVTVTPSDGGAGGTFTPTTVDIATGSESATFTYTPVSGGSKTLSVTNNGGLTNPANLTYNVTIEQHLLDSLVSYWKLDEASGTRVDSHGSNDLSDVNTVLSDTGIISNAAKFNASNAEYLAIVNNASLQVTGDFTWSLWVYGNLGASSNFPIAKSSAGGDMDYVIGYYVPGPNFFIQINNDGPSAASGPTTSTLGQWYHVVGWYDSGTSKLSIRINDGSTITGGATIALVQTTASLSFGARNVIDLPTDWLDGRMDEVGFWKRLLTADEITALYNGGAGFPYSSFSA